MVPTLRSLLICRHTVAREFRIGPIRFATRQSDWSVEHRFDPSDPRSDLGPLQAACATTMGMDRHGATEG